MPDFVWMRLKLLYLILVFLSLFLAGKAVEAGAVRFDENHVETNRQKDINKVLSILKNRVQDRCVLDRAKEKLWAMPVPRLRVVASLRDRIQSVHESRVAADIAYSLVSAMIVLS